MKIEMVSRTLTGPRSPTRAGLLLWAAMATIVATACTRSMPAPAKAKATGSPPPSFDLRDLEGQRVQLTDFRGRVIVLDFWATWCGPCLAEIPQNKVLSHRLQKRGAELIGVVFDSGEPSEIREFVQQHAIAYRQLLGTETMFDAWGATSIPTTYVVGPDGVVRGRIQGAVEGKFEQIERLAAEALADRGTGN